MSSSTDLQEARQAWTGVLPPAAGMWPRELTGSPNVPGSRDRRKHSRHPSKAIVELVREDGTRRISLPVEVVDVSSAGIGLVTVEPFAPDDHIKIRVRNDLRKFYKETHGVVRWAQLTPDGQFRIGVELSARFSSTDLQLLKQLSLTGHSEEKIWV